jgi:hypothetical protein
METPDIIDRLGGVVRAAAICNVTKGAVTIWKRTGIPPRHWEPVVRYAREHGIPGITFDTVQEARRAVKVPSRGATA